MMETSGRKVYTAPTLDSLDVRETRDGASVGVEIGIGLGS